MVRWKVRAVVSWTSGTDWANAIGLASAIALASGSMTWRVCWSSMRRTRRTDVRSRRTRTRTSRTLRRINDTDWASDIDWERDIDLVSVALSEMGCFCNVSHHRQFVSPKYFDF